MRALIDCGPCLYQRTETRSAYDRTKSSKLFYKRNIKGPLVPIYCDINTLAAVEHSRSQRNSWLCLVFLYDFSLALQLPACLYHRI